MARRSLFSRLFGSNNNSSIPQSATEFTILNGNILVVY